MGNDADFIERNMPSKPIASVSPDDLVSISAFDKSSIQSFIAEGRSCFRLEQTWCVVRYGIPSAYSRLRYVEGSVTCSVV